MGGGNADRDNRRRQCRASTRQGLGTRGARNRLRSARSVGREAPRATVEAAGGAGLFSVPRAVQGADAIVLAVPFDAVGDALAAAGDLAGRLLIDVTNPLRMGAAGLELSIGFDRSGGEHVASLAPRAAVFKTLNQVGFEVMADSAGYAAPPVMFVAGDDATRKPIVMGLVTDLGFHAVDAGGLRVARLLEPYGMLWIHMALDRNAGRDNAFAYLARGGALAG